MSNELAIPANVHSDKGARELIRAWIANNGLVCALSVDNFGDSERTTWGILLTDVARHVADALYQAKGWDKAETMKEIRRVFNAELDAPTAEPSGNLRTH